MANTLLVKRSATPSAVPTTGQLSLGEFAINTYDGKVYIKKDNGTASIVEVTGGGTGATINWAIKTSNYTASNNDGLLCDTSGGAFTVTLPASPSIGDIVHFIFEPGVSSNALSIARNGSKIMGLTEDTSVSTADLAFALVYIDATYGWRIY